MSPKPIRRVVRPSDRELIPTSAQAEKTSRDFSQFFAPNDEAIDDGTLDPDAGEKNVSGGDLLTLEQVQDQLLEVNKQKVVDEVFDWIVRNVTTFVDTRRDTFHLGFSPDDLMPECLKLQSIWQAATSKDTVNVSNEELAQMDKNASLTELLDNPAVVREAEKFEALEAYCDGILFLMEEDQEGRDKMFDAISQFFKVSGMLRDKETGEMTPVEREVEGYVQVDYFCFENYDLDVSITPMDPIVDPETNQVTGYDKRKDETTIIESPAAFCMDILVVIRDTEETGFSLF